MLGARKSPRSRQGGFILVGKGRAMLGGKPRPTLDLNFLSESIDSRLTTSGGAGGTRVNSAGVIVAASCPRIDYDPVTLACRGLLVEEQRTNLLLRSDNFFSGWALVTGTLTANAKTAPDGTNNGTRLVTDNGAVGGRVTQNATFWTAGVTYTASCWIAPGGKTSWQILFPGSLFADALLRVGTFTLTGNGSASASGGSASATITQWSNGWYRCTVTVTVDNTGTAALQIRDSVTGDGVNGVYLWGAQCEVGAFATSYIPTTSAAVTRTTDSVMMTGTNFSSWFGGGSQWTDYMEFIPVASLYSGNLLTLDDGTVSNRLRVFLRSSNQFGVDIASGGSTVSLTPPVATYSSGTVAKIAASAQASDFAGLANGNAAATGAGSMPVGVNRAILGAGTGGASPANAWLRRRRFYPTRLPNAQLQAMTQ